MATQRRSSSFMVVPPIPGRVYRQLIKGGNPIWVSPTRNPPVDSVAFIPTKEDTDGLSLIDFNTRSEVWAAHRVESPDIQRYVVLIEVSMIEEVARECLLSHEMKCDPDELDKNFGEPFSHWLAVRINRREYDGKNDVKKNIKSWAKTLASRISKESISKLQPLPSYTNRYRPASFKFNSMKNRIGELSIRLKLVWSNRQKKLTDADKPLKKH